MGCRVGNFKVGDWESVDLDGHKVEIAPATTKHLKLDGVVYKLDGRFQGFTGSKDAALFHAGRTLAARRNQSGTPEIHS